MNDKPIDERLWLTVAKNGLERTLDDMLTEMRQAGERKFESKKVTNEDLWILLDFLKNAFSKEFDKLLEISEIRRSRIRDWQDQKNFPDETARNHLYMLLIESSRECTPDWKLQV